MRAVLVILSAGASQRMGMPKALLDANGLSFLERIATTARRAGLRPLVVLARSHGPIRDAHPALPWVVNRRWRTGQMSSVRAGLTAALASRATRVLVQPVDAPLVKAATYRAVLRALSDCGAAVAHHAGEPGHPVGFQRRTARQLLQGRWRSLEEALASVVPVLVAVSDAAVVDNLNTPAAYRAAFGRAPG